MKILIDASIPFAHGVAERWDEEVIYVPSGQFTPEVVKDSAIWMVRSSDRCTAKLMAASRLRMIATATIGYDHIDTTYCDQQQIRWANAPGCNAESVGQYILSSLITLALHKDLNLQTMTLGIVGVGHVGSVVLRLCQRYGIRTLLNDPLRAEHEDGFVSLDEIAQQCDLITFHTPLTRTGDYPTYHMVDQAFLDNLARKPYLINAARGAVMDTQAVKTARQSGQIAGLIIDCWEGEPSIDLELLAMTDIATPHIAGFSYDGKANATRMAFEAIAQFLGKEPLDSSLFTPPAAANPTIDLDQLGTDAILYKEKVASTTDQAILRTYDPLRYDAILRSAPNRFEYLRSHYDHPREYKAYTLVNGKEKERTLLRSLGFQ